VPLSTPLKNGDKVEIITDPHRTPSRDWLKFVKTARARTRIKQYIRTEERARSIDLARELLEKEGRKAGINVAKAMKDGFFQKLAEEFSVASVEELLSQVGYSRITPNRVLKRLYVLLNGEKAEEARTPDKTAALAAAAEEPKTKSKSRA
jgi:GTP pyrophosphokinase